MTIIAKIYEGYTIEVEGGDKYLVKGSINIRGRYAYVCTDRSGRKVSLSRDDVIQAQKEGTARVYM